MVLELRSRWSNKTSRWLMERVSCVPEDLLELIAWRCTILGLKDRTTGSQ